MSVWFDGSQQVDCSIDDVRRALVDPGAFFLGVVRRMPGMRNVELVEQSADWVTIRTDEGTMRRTAITVHRDTDPVTVDVHEEYQAGSSVTSNAHFRDEFTPTERGVSHHLVISELRTTGFLGFLYRRFGSRKMGRAFLAAYAAHLENATT